MCLQGKSNEDAALDALNARERKELADGQGGQQTPDSQHDRDSLDGSEGSPGSDATTGPSMLQQCREVQCFEKLNCINEGTYGMVYRWPLPPWPPAFICMPAAGVAAGCCFSLASVFQTSLL